ncbi:MAG: DNA-deoxyinosine glycosylase [Methanolobus sp.]
MSRKNQYYANPRNQFWKLMSSVLNVNLESLEYAIKIETLLQHKIGLWDTLKSCDIKGSSDRSICNEEYNDFSNLSNVKKIICNGKKAEKYLKHCNVPDYIVIVGVSSSSPARAYEI